MSEKYLLATPHGWYFRRAIPKHLQATFGKSIIKKPLHVCTLAEAKTKARLLSAECERLFMKFFGTQILLNDAVFKSDGTVQFGSLNMDPNNMPAEIAALQAILESVSGIASKPTKTSLSLSIVIDSYASEKTGSGDWSPKTADEIKTALALVLESIGDQAIDSITRTDATILRETLQKLPINRSKDPLYRGKSIAQILKMPPPKDYLSTSSVNKILTRASSLWEWAKQFQYVTVNIFENLTLKTGKKSNELRCRFTTGELKLIFDSLNSPKIKGAKYWAPLIAAYSGMRLNEICQLDKADIVCIDNTYAFDINDNADDKKLKNLSSRRIVPIHRKLIELGLVDYASSSASTKLFPELKHLRDGYGQAISKWFGRFKLKAGIAADGPDFHSFRHTVADSLKQLRVETMIIEEILGHTTPGRHRSETEKTYTKQYDIAILSEAINKLTY